MKEKWFGDSADLLKWSVLLRLAEREGLLSILQVPYMQAQNDKVQFEFEGRLLEVPSPLWAFFRDLRRIQLLQFAGVTIVTVEAPFSVQDRPGYRQAVAARAHDLPRPLLLFLDPDTGLAPKHEKPEHATLDDVKSCWNMLDKGDWLALYQHARRKHDWLEEVRGELTSVCEGATVSIASRHGGGGNAAILAAMKR